MKRMRGLSAVSAVCMALTGIAGAIPALPAPAAVYAAENTDAAETEVSAEVLQFCKDALGVLDRYQAAYYDNRTDASFMYFYGSDLLKKAGKKGTVPFSELEAVLAQNGFSNWNLKNELAAIKDGSGKPVFDSEKETVTLFAETFEEQPLKTRLLSVCYDEERNCYYANAAVCEEESGDPAALGLTEFGDYCDYDAKKKTYYSIGQPVLLTVYANKSADGKSTQLSASSYKETDCYAAGGKLYALMHSETENQDYKMSYAPLNVKVLLRDAVTGDLKEAHGSFGEHRVENPETHEWTEDGKSEYTVFQDEGYLSVVFPETTRKFNNQLWKPEAGELEYELKPGKGCTVNAAYQDSKNSGTVSALPLRTEGALTLTFTLTKDPEQIKADELSGLLSVLYFYGGTNFTEDENAPDDLVIKWVNDMLSDSSYQPDELLKETDELGNVRGTYFLVPYKVFMQYADQKFAKHSDLKKALDTHYDSKADTVKIDIHGGSGGFSSSYEMLDYVEDDGVITVRGIHCTPEGGMAGWYVPEDAVEYYDYFSMVGYNGDTFRYSTGQPLEVKVRKTENDYQLLSFVDVPSVRFGDHLYTRTYEKEPHDYNTPFTNIVYTPVTVTVLDNKTGLPVEVKTTLDGKGGFTAATADGKIKVTASEGIETLYDNIGWRYAVNPLTFTVTGDCTVNGIDGKELKSAGKEKTYQLAAKDGASEIVLSFGKAPETGDLSGDGEVGIEDAQNALIAYTEALSGNDPKLTPAQQKAADINGDGELTVEDAQYILMYYTENTVAGNTVTWEQLLKK